MRRLVRPSCERIVIAERYSSAIVWSLSGADDSANDSWFAENLDTQLKSVGTVNSRHYTIFHDTYFVEGITELLLFLSVTDFFISICPEKKSAAIEVVAFADLWCRSFLCLFLTTVNCRWQIKNIAFKNVTPQILRSPRINSHGERNCIFYNVGERGASCFSSSCSSFSFGHKPSDKSIALKFESSYCMVLGHDWADEWGGKRYAGRRKKSVTVASGRTWSADIYCCRRTMRSHCPDRPSYYYCHRPLETLECWALIATREYPVRERYDW